MNYKKEIVVIVRFVDIISAFPILRLSAKIKKNNISDSINLFTLSRNFLLIVSPVRKSVNSCYKLQILNKIKVPDTKIDFVLNKNIIGQNITKLIRINTNYSTK